MNKAGKRIKALSVSGSTIHINVEDISHGLYMIKIVNEDHSVVIKKFMKKE